MKTGLHKLLFFIFSLSFVFQIKIAETETITIPRNEKAKVDFILANYNVGKKYYNLDNIRDKKNLLIGNWNSPPHTSFTLKNDNTLSMSIIEGAKRDYAGKWNINNNTLVFDINNQKFICEINYCILKDFKDSALYDYLSYRYSFTISFKKDYFWGGSLEMGFK